MLTTSGSTSGASVVEVVGLVVGNVEVVVLVLLVVVAAVVLMEAIVSLVSSSSLSSVLLEFACLICLYLFNFSLFLLNFLTLSLLSGLELSS